MKFNLAEKLAIVKAIDEVILVDGRVSYGEVTLLNQLLQVLKFDRKLIEEARDITAVESLSILRDMTTSKKHALAVILKEIAAADGVVDERELELMNKIFAQAGIEVLERE